MYSKEIERIWGDDFIRVTSYALWHAHLDWLYSLGWKRAKEYKSQTKEMKLTGTGHEVVDLLSDFVHETGLVNAHIGLTSSDIIDNVRLVQVRQSLIQIDKVIYEVIRKLRGSFAFNTETPGFTHWQIAAPIEWQFRYHAWMMPITALTAAPPVITAKKFGGPVGDARSLRNLIGGTLIDDNPFDWTPFDLEFPQNPFPRQSSDFICETASVTWVCALMAQIHKIAADLRFLASHGLVKINRPTGHAGSSSMPHKTNPYKWEKVCGIARSVSSTAHEVWTVAAHNGLERTLDGSWQLKTALRRCFRDAAYALETMASVDVQIDFNQSIKLLNDHYKEVWSDVNMMERVIRGETRWDAYRAELAKQNKS